MPSTDSPRRRRTRRSAAEWRQLIKAQVASGLSPKVFCESEGIAYASFCNWRRRLGGTDDDSTPQFDGSDFVELTVPAVAGSTWDVELSLGSGVTLRLRRAIQ